MHEHGSSPPTPGKTVTPYVPEQTSLKEFTPKALILGVVMAAVLGAANAYLGLKAGMTVSATFPAAVVAMAALRLMKGSILEENIARTTASVGEALVAGAIFTLPAFLMVGAWESLGERHDHAGRRCSRGIDDHLPEEAACRRSNVSPVS